jgi:hypothetical protein
MSRKNKKSKKLDGEVEQASAETNENLTETAAAAEEPSAVESDSFGTPDASASDTADEPASRELTPDDLLDDVRRALIEEDETAETQKQSKWWRRIGRGSAKLEPDVEEPKVVEEIDLPIAMEAEIDELKEELETEEQLEQIDDLIDLLEDAPVTETPAPVVVETPVEPDKVVDIEELKKQAFQSRTTDAGETLSEVRSIALEGEEEVFVEVESKPQDPFDERLKAVENAFKPYRRYINFALAFLGVVMAVIAGLIIYSVYQQSRPEPLVVEESTLPFPTAVSLPGGWSFNLGKGSLNNSGRWQPKGAEWLEGTEVCRWVSLPWNRQLEAVVRTLNADDPIELGMSNSDKLVYKVYSIQQMSPEEMQKLDSNKPCLLIMLADENAEQRWVLTALP